MKTAIVAALIVAGFYAVAWTACAAVYLAAVIHAKINRR